MEKQERKEVPFLKKPNKDGTRKKALILRKGTESLLEKGESKERRQSDGSNRSRPNRGEKSVHHGLRL